MLLEQRTVDLYTALSFFFSTCRHSLWCETQNSLEVKHGPTFTAKHNTIRTNHKLQLHSMLWTLTQGWQLKERIKVVVWGVPTVGGDLWFQTGGPSASFKHCSLERYFKSQHKPALDWRVFDLKLELLFKSNVVGSFFKNRPPTLAAEKWHKTNWHAFF